MIAPSNINFQDLRYIVFRNLFSFSNGVIFTVVILLFVFGNHQAGLFLGIISVVNIAAGLFQDIRAWIALAKLQLLTAPRVIRLSTDGTEEIVLTEEIKKGDHIKLKIGDQIPCDSILLESIGLEINEGLITGESNSIPQKNNDHLLAGSIVTSGSGIIEVVRIFKESRIAQMTEGIRKYTVNVSSIQGSVNTVIKYTGYSLVAIIAFVIIRSAIVGQPIVDVVLNIGTLASIIIPQGLVFAVTLFFAYGAANLFKKHVLLQEVNATEKLGRIKNLCMDKTGTLTQNTLSVESIVVAPGISKEEAGQLAAAYAQGSQDSSQIISAIKDFLGEEHQGNYGDILPFSPWRGYGAVHVSSVPKESVVLAGSSDIFMPQISSETEKEWLKNLVTQHAAEGKHMLCIVQTLGAALPQKLSGVPLSVVAVFVFHNNLREGIQDTINFFQLRGVRIHIITGDSPETAHAVVRAAGINNPDAIITGKEIESWDAADYVENVKKYTVFARIVPEQKEKIVEAFKVDGFTAMVGDGANDALAIKKADLGIAMFDGAPATRELAAVVLTNNSFSAMPGGVALADSIIHNIEIFASMFFNQTMLAFLFFVVVSAFGYSYPLTPFNVTVINYGAIGLPGLLISYWTIFPTEKAQPASDQSFLKRVLPFAAASAVIQALGIAIVFLLTPESMRTAHSNMPVLIAFIALGFTYFVCAPQVYHEAGAAVKKYQFYICAIAEIILLYALYRIPFLSTFFNISHVLLSATTAAEIGAVILVFCFAQYLLMKDFFIPASAPNNPIQS